MHGLLASQSCYHSVLPPSLCTLWTSSRFSSLLSRHPYILLISLEIFFIYFSRGIGNEITCANGYNTNATRHPRCGHMHGFSALLHCRIGTFPKFSAQTFLQALTTALKDSLLYQSRQFCSFSTWLCDERNCFYGVILDAD